MNSDDHRPAFSVVLPTYNRAHLLPRAIQSVLDQTYEDFELIVVDDASTDQTREVVASFHDERIVYIRLEVNSGVSIARNTAIAQARGEYISLLDDDDEYLPNFLAETHRALEPAPATVGFAWGGVRWVRDTSVGEVVINDKLWQPQFEDRGQAYLAFLRPTLGTGWGVTIRRRCFGSVEWFDEALRVHQDHEFFPRLARQFDFVVIPETLIKVHYHSGPRVTLPGPNRAEDYERIIQKHYAALRENRDLWVLLHYLAGYAHYSAGNKPHGREFTWRAIQRNPFHIRSWLAIALYETLGSRALQVHEGLFFLRTRLNTWLRTRMR